MPEIEKDLQYFKEELRIKLIEIINKTVDEHQCLGAAHIADGILSDLNEYFSLKEQLAQKDYIIKHNLDLAKSYLVDIERLTKELRETK